MVSWRIARMVPPRGGRVRLSLWAEGLIARPGDPTPVGRAFRPENRRFRGRSARPTGRVLARTVSTGHTGGMRSHCSLYVDVGYLLASAATRVTGTSLRNGIHVDYGALIEGLIEQAQEISGLPILRVHWYDSARDGLPDDQQQRIGMLPKVKLRLGRFGVDGQQKGVDLRIGLDLVAHARNDAADCFLL